MFVLPKNKIKNNYRACKCLFDLYNELSLNDDYEKELKILQKMILSLYKDSQVYVKDGIAFKLLYFEENHVIFIYCSNGIVCPYNLPYLIKHEKILDTININDLLNSHCVALLESFNVSKNAITYVKNNNEEKVIKIKKKTKHQQAVSIDSYCSQPLMTYWLLKNNNCTNMNRLIGKCKIKGRHISDIFKDLNKLRKFNIQDENIELNKRIIHNVDFKITNALCIFFDSLRYFENEDDMIKTIAKINQKFDNIKAHKQYHYKDWYRELMCYQGTELYLCRYTRNYIDYNLSLIYAYYDKLLELSKDNVYLSEPLKQLGVI